MPSSGNFTGSMLTTWAFSLSLEGPQKKAQMRNIVNRVLDCKVGKVSYWPLQGYLFTCWATSSFLSTQSIRFQSCNVTSSGPKVKKNPCGELVVRLPTLAQEGGNIRSLALKHSAFQAKLLWRLITCTATSFAKKAKDFPETTRCGA